MFPKCYKCYANHEVGQCPIDTANWEGYNSEEYVQPLKEKTKVESKVTETTPNTNTDTKDKVRWLCIPATSDTSSTSTSITLHDTKKLALDDVISSTNYGVNSKLKDGDHFYLMAFYDSGKVEIKRFVVQRRYKEVEWRNSPGIF